MTQENAPNNLPAENADPPVTPKVQSSVGTSPPSAVTPDNINPTPSTQDTSQQSPTTDTDLKSATGAVKEELQVTL